MKNSLLRRLILFPACLLVLLPACQSPVGVTRVSPDVVHQDLTRNVLSAHEPSQASMNVLGQYNLRDKWLHEPEEALSALHRIYAEKPGRSHTVFALSELSFMNAERTRKRSYYLASSLYAYAFLFPENAEEAPDPFDRRFRVACDLYNRGLTEGFKGTEKTEVKLRAGSYELPFGRLEVEFPEDELVWIGRRLDHFIPVAEVEIHGLRNRYRTSGIGAPLAAEQVLLHEEKGFQVAPRLKVPVTALLRIDQPTRQLTDGQVRASLELYVAMERYSVQIGGRRVPLEIETSSFLAASLQDSPVWQQEVEGFFGGGAENLFATQMGALEPYRPGRFPVVFVHGTASSAGRWAEMLNDLMNDPQLYKRFQVWFFTYDTGNPITYSAMQLRDSLREALDKIDPEQRDAALRHMVVIGHSQGGLLTKLTVVDTDDRIWNAISSKPLDEMDITPDEKELLRRMVFVKPVPEVRRVVFISTPHRGSFISATWAAKKLGEMVKFPGKVGKSVGDLMTKEKDALKIDTETYQAGAVFGMKPGNPALMALADTPIDSRVTAHSIIPVKGTGPYEKGNDGVVKYKSAHLDGVESELVVRSGHSTQSFPPTIEEVRRILLLHAETWCGKEVKCDDGAVATAANP